MYVLQFNVHCLIPLDPCYKPIIFLPPSLYQCRELLLSSRWNSFGFCPPPIHREILRPDLRLSLRSQVSKKQSILIAMFFKIPKTVTVVLRLFLYLLLEVRLRKVILGTRWPDRYSAVGIENYF